MEDNSQAQPKCPACGSQVRYYEEPYAMGGTVEIQWCLVCGWGMRVLPAWDADFEPWTQRDVPGRNTKLPIAAVVPVADYEA